MSKALKYHSDFPKGKIHSLLHKPLETLEDLQNCYTPGVAEVCNAIIAHPENIYEYTNKSNLVAVITNGSAVLGLGNIGVAAAKPVMEGKAALMKRLANIDAIDIQIDCNNPKKFVEIVKSICSGFGGILLEDICAPDCFYIEETLQKELSIPVFHDDQHGSAIVVTAGILQALKQTNKKAENVKWVVHGAGAAAIASINLLLEYGFSKKNLAVIDSKGVINYEREDTLPKYKKQFMSHFTCFDTALENADVLIGLSSPNSIHSVKKMSDKSPIVFALSNPFPEISHEVVLKEKPSAIFACGGSTYKNQINNLLCFPYIMRRALDNRSKISMIEKKLAVEALMSIDISNCESNLLPHVLDSRLYEAFNKKIFKRN